MEPGRRTTNVGPVTRYFLRRYAQAKRDPNNANDSVPYYNAAIETSGIFVGIPTATLLGLVLIVSMRWPLVKPAQFHGFSPRLVIVALSFLALAIGHLLLAPRFKRFRLNPGICAEFDSERDRKIIFRQKAIALVVCGIVIPWIAIVLTLWVF